jgi:hypothetical protein
LPSRSLEIRTPEFPASVAFVPPRVNPFALSAIELINSGDELSRVNVETSAPVLETFHTVAIVRSARVGTFGSTMTLSGFIGATVGVALGVTIRALALEPAIQMLPTESAAIAVAILATPCVSGRRHLSEPSTPIARTAESLSKIMDGPTTNIFVSGVMGVARLIATISFTTMDLGAADALCEENMNGIVKSATAKRFTIM